MATLIPDSVCECADSPSAAPKDNCELTAGVPGPVGAGTPGYSDGVEHVPKELIVTTLGVTVVRMRNGPSLDS